ncbi:MAG: redoxin domain-containing protein [Candidatus Methylomirabilales bacterium]
MSTKTRKKSKRKGRSRVRVAAGSSTQPKTRPTPRRPRSHPARRGRGLSAGTKAGAAIVLAVGVLAVLFYLNRGGGPSGGKYAYDVGNPGPGEQGPPIRLPSTEGGTFDLSSMNGTSVLLFFQEGLMCQPCWDQLRDIEAGWGRFQALGIEEVVTITTDPLDGLKQKVADEGLSTPVLSDQGVAVSEVYATNQYGMMGEGFNGHSFIAVGPDGTILWRADYGGPPDHTMYLPVDSLIADLREGLREAS